MADRVRWPHSPWPARDPQLLELLAAGTSRIKAARIMNVSLGQVCGRVHRLRQLGIIPPAVETASVTARRRNQQAAALAAAASRSNPRLTPVAPRVPPIARPTRGALRAPVVAPRSPVTARAAAPIPYGRVISCCWPLGDVAAPAFRFCEEPSMPGRPYCDAHCRKAYPGAARRMAGRTDSELTA